MQHILTTDVGRKCCYQIFMTKIALTNVYDDNISTKYFSLPTRFLLRAEGSETKERQIIVLKDLFADPSKRMSIWDFATERAREVVQPKN